MNENNGKGLAERLPVDSEEHEKELSDAEEVREILEGAFSEPVSLRKDIFGSVRIGTESERIVASYNEYNGTWWLHPKGGDPTEFRTSERLKRTLVEKGLYSKPKRETMEPVSRSATGVPVPDPPFALDWEEDVNGDLSAEISFLSERIQVRIYYVGPHTGGAEDWEYTVRLGGREIDSGIPSPQMETDVYRDNSFKDKKRFVEGRIIKEVDQLQNRLRRP